MNGFNNTVRKCYLREFLLILILIFSLQSWTKADDISEFEIEGMSIGDSLLNFISESKINNLKKSYYPNSKKYVRYYSVKKSDIYDDIDVYVIDSDKKYIIHSFSGIMNHYYDIENCYPKKEKIVKEIQTELGIKPFSYIADYPNDTTKSDVSDFDFTNGAIRVFCTDYSEKTEDEGYGDFLSVSVSRTEFTDWLDTAY